MGSARSARRPCWLVPALLSGLVVFGSTIPVAHAEKPAKAVAGKGATKGADKADEGKRAEARKNYAEGEARFAAGDYDAAYRAYKAANDTMAAPQTLYKMALCLDKQSRPVEAVSAYETFLASNPPSSMEARVSEAQGRITDLKKRMLAPVVKVASEPPGAAVSVDGIAQMGSTPLDVTLAPGHHKIRVTSPGFAGVDREIDVESGATRTVDVMLSKETPAATPAPLPPKEEAPAPKPAEAPAAEQRSNTVAYALIGIAGVGAVVGTVFGIKALGDKSDFNNGEKTNEKADSVEKNALIADMAFGAALTLGVTGVVLLVSNSGSSTEKAGNLPRQAFQLVPIISPDRAGAAATLRF